MSIFCFMAGVTFGCVLMDIMKEILSLCSENIRYWIPRAIVFCIFVANIFIFQKYGG